MTTRSQDIIRKLYENNEVMKVMKIQACMKSYLATKKANSSKFGCYEFKDFNAD